VSEKKEAIRWAVVSAEEREYAWDERALRTHLGTVVGGVLASRRYACSIATNRSGLVGLMRRSRVEITCVHWRKISEEGSPMSSYKVKKGQNPSEQEEEGGIKDKPQFVE